MVRAFVFVLAVQYALSGLATEPQEPVGPYLQSVSVNVLCAGTSSGGGSQGSGTVFLAEVDGKPSAWILTAHHVVAGLREVQTVIGSDGDERKAVRYRDAQVIQEQVESGRAVGEVKYDAAIITVDARRDIALLRVRKGDFSKAGARFHLDDTIPAAGSLIYHCGAPGGREVGGTCSLTSGIISRIGVRIPDFGGGSEHGVFDQTDTAALGGSSGGLVALHSDGRWVGMITLGLGAGDNFHWLVPARSVKEWAATVKVLWLLDPSQPRPTEEDIRKIPLENVSPGFTADGKAPTPAPPNPNNLQIGHADAND